jgi:Protein of unknown function (DUF1501)/Secretion system C-terminal sorting domain
MLDPLAIEMGTDTSLIFHQSDGFPTSISLENPESFANLVEDLDGFKDVAVDRRGFPPNALDNSLYGKELWYILGLEDKTKDYAKRLLEVYQKSADTTVTYPEVYPFNAPEGSKRNGLTAQLKLISRLLAGGCKTKVFLVKIGGFDTHAQQAESYDPTMGVHAALVYHISSAMKAFQEDLRVRGIEHKVMSVTTSEFGRRIESNGSYGTDHGTGGPLFIFGAGVKPGVTGHVPDLTKSNVEMQYDYRQIYGSIVKNWLGVDEAGLNIIFPGLTSTDGTSDGVKFEEMAIVSNVISGNENFMSTRFYLDGCYPNPAKHEAEIRFRINTANEVTIDLYDNKGNIASVLVKDFFEAGEHAVKVDLSSLSAGHYVYQLKSGFFKDSKKLVIIN